MSTKHEQVQKDKGIQRDVRPYGGSGENYILGGALALAANKTAYAEGTGLPSFWMFMRCCDDDSRYQSHCCVQQFFTKGG